MQSYYFKILKKHSKFILLNCIILLSIYSCEDIIAEDISNENMETIIPLQNDMLTSSSINFKWEEVEFTDQYRIQIAKPNFINPTEFTIDSLVTVTDISFALEPNFYQWRVKALNNISETNYSTPIDFEVDIEIDLSSQIVILNSPQDGVFLNSIQQNFTWEFLTAADTYTFQLVKGDETSNNIVDQETLIQDNFYLPSITDLEEENYTWKVQAVNATSQTFFEFRQFGLDKTAPNTPSVLSPENAETVNSEVDFSWNLGVDGGVINAPIKSVLEISITSNFVVLFYSVELETNQHNYTFPTTGTFYWRVKAFDEAGNIGLNSNVREIIVE